MPEENHTLGYTTCSRWQPHMPYKHQYFKITFLGSSLFKQTTFPEELKSIYFDEKHGYLIHYNMFSGCVYHENFPQFVSNYQTVKNCVGDLLKVTIY